MFHKVFVIYRQCDSWGGEDNNDGSYVASLVGKQVGEAKKVTCFHNNSMQGSPYSIVVFR